MFHAFSHLHAQPEVKFSPRNKGNPAPADEEVVERYTFHKLRKWVEANSLRIPPFSQAHKTTDAPILLPVGHSHEVLTLVEPTKK